MAITFGDSTSTKTIDFGPDVERFQAAQADIAQLQLENIEAPPQPIHVHFTTIHIHNSINPQLFCLIVAEENTAGAVSSPDRAGQVRLLIPWQSRFHAAAG